MTNGEGIGYEFRVMNFGIPEEKEIHRAFAEDEEALVALFGGVTAQVEEFAAQSSYRLDSQETAVILGNLHPVHSLNILTPLPESPMIFSNHLTTM